MVKPTTVPASSLQLVLYQESVFFRPYPMHCTYYYTKLSFKLLEAARLVQKRYISYSAVKASLAASC